MFKVGSFTHLRAVATIDVSIMEYSSFRCYESEFDVFQEMCDRDCQQLVRRICSRQEQALENGVSAFIDSFICLFVSLFVYASNSVGASMDGYGGCIDTVLFSMST